MTNSKSATKSPQQPVQARAIETRARIIEVAMKTFAERGYTLTPEEQDAE